MLWRNLSSPMLTVFRRKREKKKKNLLCNNSEVHRKKGKSASFFFTTFNMFVGKKHNLNYNIVCVVRFCANAEPLGGGEDDPPKGAEAEISCLISFSLTCGGAQKVHKRELE